MTTISESMANDLVEDLGMDDGTTAYPDYSGRGMFGKTCFGIVTDESVGAVCIRLGKAIGEHMAAGDYDLWNCIAEDLEYVSTDNMGRDTIVYFRNIEVEMGV